MIGRIVAFVAGALTTLAAIAIYAGPDRRPAPIYDPDQDLRDLQGGRPGYRDSIAGGDQAYELPAPLFVGRHDPLCHWPRRPCVCISTRSITQP